MESPFAATSDRFPLGLPGHRAPVDDTAPTQFRPWGMDRARRPAAVRSHGKHEKPTATRQEKVPTEYTDDSETRRDEYTQTVTD
jgi:hypothetical protein